MTDREKLIELIERAHHNASAVMAGGEGSYDDGLEEEVNYLLANGVTVQKHGRWEREEIQIAPFGVTQVLVCTSCGYDHGYDEWFDICPNCGARMDGGDK